MRTIPLLLLALLTTVQAHAESPRCAPSPTYSGRGANGGHADLIIPDSAARSAPPWTPGRGEPPISVEHVVTIASTWAAAHHAPFDELRISAITLNGLPCTGKDVPWYYRVDFDPVLKGEVLHSSLHFIAVLMDGSIIEPRRVESGS